MKNIIVLYRYMDKLRLGYKYTKITYGEVAYQQIIEYKLLYDIPKFKEVIEQTHNLTNVTILTINENYDWWDILNKHKSYIRNKSKDKN